MTDKHIEQLIKVSMLYYEKNMTQQEVAKELGTTRQAVNRYLNESRKCGIVEIKVTSPSLNTDNISRLFLEKYKLDKVLIVPGKFADEAVVRYILTQKAAEYLEQVMQENTFKAIGLSWGKTVLDIVKQFPRDSYDVRAEVVPLLGGTDNTANQFAINEIVMTFAKKINSIARQIHLPLVPATEEDYLHFTSTTLYSKVLDCWKNIDIALVGIGSMPIYRNSVKEKYPNESEILNALISNNIVGDICTKYFDESGRFYETTQSKQLITIPGEYFKSIKRVIAVAGGQSKIKSIKGALNTGVISEFITDEQTALSLLSEV